MSSTTIFVTNRLRVRPFRATDKAHFIELLDATEIITPIPQARLSIEEINTKFTHFTDYSKHPLDAAITAWGVYQQHSDELIGLCALLTNHKNERQIAYRFRQAYWGIGYGSEVAEALLSYCFTVLGLDFISADVNIENIGSVRILEKFLHPLRTFYNTTDQCWDRRYGISKIDWQDRSTTRTTTHTSHKH